MQVVIFFVFLLIFSVTRFENFILVKASGDELGREIVPSINCPLDDGSSVWGLHFIAD